MNADVNGTTALQTGQFNFNPVLNFDDVDDEADLDPAPSADDFTIFVVFSTANTANGSGHWRTYPTILNNEVNGPTDDFGLVMDDGDMVWYKQPGGGNTEVIRTTNQVASTTSIPQLGTIIRDVTTGSVAMRHNGVSQGVGGGELGTLAAGGPPTRIEFFGSNNAALQGDLVGKLGEVIFFGTEVTGGALTRVESYLALKYGITKPTDYVNSSGTLVYSVATHGNQIIGIINDPGSDLTQQQSVPAGFPNGFSLYNADGYGGTYLTDNEQNSNTLAPFQSMVIGHDNGSVVFDAAFMGMSNARIGRVFKMTDLNGVGPVTLNFKQATFSAFVGGQAYTLVFNPSDATFATGNVFIPLIRNGATSDYRCEYDFPDNTTGYFTILEGSMYGPGGIGAGLEAWYAADSALATHIPPTTWGDISGRGRNLSNALSATTTVTRGGVNFNHFVRFPSLNRQCATSAGLISRTIFMVSKLGGSGGADLGIMGFDNAEGVLLTVPGPSLSNENDGQEFHDIAGEYLRVNGKTRANNDNPPFNNSWMVGAFHRGATNPTNLFYLGGFNASFPSPANLDFGEAIVYSKPINDSVPLKKIESYLAMKYGVSLGPPNHYYASNWNGTGGTTVYTSTGYSNNVTVVGRDDRSRLYQKQSKNNAPEATITLGLNGIFADSNAANTATLANDLTFVAVGDNGGDDCWTNTELNMVTNVRQWLRVGREWKITKTGTIGNVAIRIASTAGTNFKIPPLPAGATGYVLLLSSDNDFSTGAAATVIPLADNISYLQGTLTNAQLATGGGTNYFTLGVQLPSSYQTLVPCVGDVVEFVGRDIGELSPFCLGFGIPATYDINLGTTMDADSFQLVGPGAVGCLDTVQWTVPVGFTGAHFLTTAATCGGTLDTRLINDSLRIGAPITPMISLGGSDTVFLCTGDPNVTLDRASNPGNGILSVFHYPGAIASPLLSLVDSVSLQLTASGTVYVHPGNLGHHLLTYRYPSGCSSTDSVHIYIGTPSAATYSYPSSPLCLTDTAAQLATTVPNQATTGGVFSSFPTGLSLNAATGVVRANTSAPGAYLATFTPHDSTCAQPATIPVVVQVPTQTVFDYPTDICPGRTGIFPTVTTYASGGTFSITPTTGVTINATSGMLTTTTAAAGSYHITYNAPGTCSVDNVDSIFVLPQPTVTFPALGTAGEVCKLTPTVTASAIPVGGVYSTFTPSSTLALTGNTIDVTNSQVGGPYIITYLYTDVSGCTDTVSNTLTILPYDNPMVDYLRDGYCTDELPQAPQFLSPNSAAGVFTSLPGGLNLSTNGTITPALSTPGIYTISFAYTHPACPAAVAVDVVEIAPAVLADINMPDSVCFGAGSVAITPVASATLDSLQLFFQGALMPNSNLHLQSGNSVVFTNGASVLTGDLSYTVVNTVTNSLGCTNQGSASFVLKADQNSSFEYLDSLYCANTSNPTPFIYGIGGGVFSSPTLTALELDPGTGVVDLLAAYTGSATTDTFAITYTTPGPCASSSTDIIFLREGYDSYFQFPLNIVCSSDSTVATVDLVEDSVGISGFLQIGGPNVTFDPQTGVITNLQNIAIPPGAVDTIVMAHWTGSTNKCQDTTVQSLQINKFDNLFGISYTPDVVCADTLVPPALTGNTSSSIVNNPVGVTYANLGLGVVDARFSQAGIHEIILIDRDVCGERASAFLEILGLPDASFSYNAPGSCSSDSVFSPDTSSIQTPNGVFSYSTADTFFDLGLDPITGIITLEDSDPASYMVYYSVVSSNGCVNTDSQFVIISESPILTSLVAQPNSSICIGDTVTFLSQGSGTVTWYVDNAPVNRTGPSYTSNTVTNGQVIKAVLRNTAGCADSLSLVMEVLPPPTVAVVDRPSVITENDPFSIQLQPGQDNTIIAWRAEALGLAIRDTMDTTGVLGIGDIQALTNALTLFSDYDPGTINYWFTPITNGCIGPPEFISIIVNPNGDRVFIPEVMTPNNDIANDLWEIRYDSDLISTDYRIEVYNRSGGLVHTVMNLDERWDGGGNPDGVYWWILRHIDGTVESQGGLTIRRQ